MSEMIERVARAIATEDFDRPEEVAWDFALRNDDRTMYRKFARAAFKAMREPTEAMITAHTRRSMSSIPGDYSHFVSEAKQAWRAMIDAALEDKSP